MYTERCLNDFNVQGVPRPNTALSMWNGDHLPGGTVRNHLPVPRHRSARRQIKAWRR